MLGGIAGVGFGVGLGGGIGDGAGGVALVGVKTVGELGDDVTCVHGGYG